MKILSLHSLSDILVDLNVTERLRDNPGHSRNALLNSNWCEQGQHTSGLKELVNACRV